MKPIADKKTMSHMARMKMLWHELEQVFTDFISKNGRVDSRGFHRWEKQLAGFHERHFTHAIRVCRKLADNGHTSIGIREFRKHAQQAPLHDNVVPGRRRKIDKSAGRKQIELIKQDVGLNDE